MINFPKGCSFDKSSLNSVPRILINSFAFESNLMIISNIIFSIEFSFLNVLQRLCIRIVRFCVRGFSEGKSDVTKQHGLLIKH